MVYLHSGKFKDMISLFKNPAEIRLVFQKMFKYMIYLTFWKFKDTIYTCFLSI